MRATRIRYRAAVDFSQPFESIGQPPPPPPTAPPRQEALPHLQPEPVAQPAPPVMLAPPATSHSTGGGVLLAAAGTGTGYVLGGGWGALAGLLLTGAMRNAVRAANGDRSPAPGGGFSEATKSGTMAIFGFGLGGYFAYLASQRERPSR